MLKLKNKSNKKKKGQSTLEYIILVTGIVILLLIFLGPNGMFSRTLNTTLSTTSDSMINMANRIRGSRP